MTYNTKKYTQYHNVLGIYIYTQYNTYKDTKQFQTIPKIRKQKYLIANITTIPKHVPRMLKYTKQSNKIQHTKMHNPKYKLYKIQNTKY